MNLVGACMHFRNEQVIFNFFVLHTIFIINVSMKVIRYI